MKKISRYIRRLLRPSEQTKPQTIQTQSSPAINKTAAGHERPVNTEKPRPTRTFNQFFEHVKSLGFTPGTIIDVGAARGTPDLYRSFPDAYLVLFEPLPDFVPELEKIVSKRKGEYHICALMSESGSSTILKSADKFGSSMMHKIEDEHDQRLVPVEVNTLDEMIKPELQSPMILKTDCQGGDFDVIRGGNETLQKCEIVVMEISLFQFWGGHHPKPLEILNYMNERGFVLYDFLDGLFRPYDNALGQLDMVFVRENGIFRKSQQWAAAE